MGGGTGGDHRTDRRRLGGRRRPRLPTAGGHQVPRRGPRGRPGAAALGDRSHGAAVARVTRRISLRLRGIGDPTMKLNHLNLTVTDVPETRNLLAKYFGLRD